MDESTIGSENADTEDALEAEPELATEPEAEESDEPDLFADEKREALAMLSSIELGVMDPEEIYELMKRPDEMSVVVKAHSQPRFVEDCVREMIRQVIETYPGLADEGFVMARQENLETIHRHNVVAERFGTVEDMRRAEDGRFLQDHEA